MPDRSFETGIAAPAFSPATHLEYRYVTLGPLTPIFPSVPGKVTIMDCYRYLEMCAEFGCGQLAARKTPLDGLRY
jgi:hypothetical protein